MVIFIRTIILYIIVVVFMRIMGKRQIGELQPFELVIAIMLSELAAIPMQDTGIPIIHGIIPIMTLLLLEILISYLSLKFQGLRKVVCGVPSTIISHGKVDEMQLKKQRFNLDDLLEELRLSGYIDISDIEYAIMETNGKLTVIPKASKANVTLENLNIKVPEVKLPISIILDGKLNLKNLHLIGKNTDWLDKELKKIKVHHINEVFIAIYDSKGELFVQRRDEIK